MKTVIFYSLIFPAVLIVFSFSTAKAQTDAPAENAANNRRAELLEELGFTPEQIRQYRRINAENRPQMRAAQQRLKEATRALDEAVYSDAPDEAMIQTRVKEAQAAHAEVIRIRTQSELAVRRILTAEQLAKFREVRRRFQSAAEERQLNKKENLILRAPNRNKRLNRRQQRTNVAPND